MTKMLERLLGETITLEFQPPPELPFVQGDSGMIEQVMMNLAVNARDAMPRGGRLTIGIDAVTIDAAYVETHPEARAGRFVRLRVTDTGIGMDAATCTAFLSRFSPPRKSAKAPAWAWPPFMASSNSMKAGSKSTANPAKAHLRRVFPRQRTNRARPEKKTASCRSRVAGGTETILIVEDEPILRDMARDILEECGYRILEASSGKEALDVWQRQSDEIDLLLTDMVMPEGISGVDLAKQLLASQPRLKVIFTSGYTANEVNPELLVKMNARFLAQTLHPRRTRQNRPRLPR